MVTQLGTDESWEMISPQNQIQGRGKVELIMEIGEIYVRLAFSAFYNCHVIRFVITRTATN